jgi:hypothetical protein
MPATWTCSEEYRPRRTTFHDVRELEGWRLKVFSIVYGTGVMEWTVYDDVWPLIRSALPQPAVTPCRPGVGFFIAHTGRGVHYAVLGWWDNENELPIRLFVREFGDNTEWRAGTGAESVCVWDIQVIAHERDVYVAQVLSKPDQPDLEGYLYRHFEVSG